jgi:phosphatidate phosphatase APP1
MKRRPPVLLNFYALSNGASVWLQGQLTGSSLKDFSFLRYSWRKTFRSILALYRTHYFANEEVALIFDTNTIQVTTDALGAFQITTDAIAPHSKLIEVRLASGASVRMVENLYSYDVHVADTKRILISDIDDTLLHSHITRKFLKFRTLMFTAVEDRKAVQEMMAVVNDFAAMGVTPFYLSNSEQNLYPVIYRFLRNNNFPRGPLFLRQLRKLRDVLKRKNILTRNAHKLDTLEKLMEFFPGKKFILVGDNTQRDLEIYLSTAEKYPDRVERVIIRKVVSLRDATLLDTAREKFSAMGIRFHYDTHFPNGFEEVSVNP